MVSNEKEVDFNKYCITCVYAVKVDDDGLLIETCEDCLATPMNIDSHKPVNYKEDVK